MTAHSYLLVAVPIVAALSLFGALAIHSTFILGHGTVYGLVPMFLLDAEGNVPTFFSALNLVLCGLLLIIAGVFAKRSGRRHWFSWMLLGLGALFVAVDEAAQIHELLDRNPQWTGGRLRGEHSPWVIVYGALALAFIVATGRLFLYLPLRYKLLFALGGAMFVGAAVGLEILGAAELVTEGKTLYYAVVNGTEEMIEMAAVTLVNASVLSYIRATHGPLTICIR